MSEDSEELLRSFRTAWRQELEDSRQSKSDTLDVDCDNEDNKDLRLSTFSFNKIKQDKTKPQQNLNLKLKSLNQSKQDIVLISLPNPAAHQTCPTRKTSKKQKLDGISLDNEENLLELLISDIDEITVIPFFDMQLPREIGLKIFQFLDIKDLCHCAVVSKSWRNLAEDEILWFNFAAKLGFAANNSIVSEKTDWKGFIHKRITEQSHLQSRWKERVCKVDVMEYERGNLIHLPPVEYADRCMLSFDKLHLYQNKYLLTSWYNKTTSFFFWAFFS